jgi:hypothetical protein
MGGRRRDTRNKLEGQGVLKQSVRRPAKNIFGEPSADGSFQRKPSRSGITQFGQIVGELAQLGEGIHRGGGGPPGDSLRRRSAIVVARESPLPLRQERAFKKEEECSTLRVFPPPIYRLSVSFEARSNGTRQKLIRSETKAPSEAHPEGRVELFPRRPSFRRVAFQAARLKRSQYTLALSAVKMWETETASPIRAGPPHPWGDIPKTHKPTVVTSIRIWKGKIGC